MKVQIAYARRLLAIPNGGCWRALLITLQSLIIAALALSSHSLWSQENTSFSDTPLAVEFGPHDDLLEVLEQAALDGNLKASLELGNRYYRAAGGQSDLFAARHWWQLARSMGSARAAYNLGVTYTNEQSGPRELDKAAELFREAAAENIPMAHFALGTLVLDGATSPGDYRAAGEHFLRAAELGVAPARHNLAVMYERGIGFEQSFELAEKWRLESSKAKDIPAAADPDLGHSSNKESPSALAPAGEIYDAGWIREQDPNAYTLQIVSGDTLAATKALVKKVNDFPSAIFSKPFGDDERHVAIAGQFTNYREALSAIAKLPQKIQQKEPFIVKFKVLQAQIAEHTDFNN